MRNERRCVVAVAFRREYYSLVINLFAGKARLEGYHPTELSLLKDPNDTFTANAFCGSFVETQCFSNVAAV
jgi:hypothetical protein